MATLAQINGRIKAAGYSDIELVKGEGYLYFIFDDRGPNYETESVMVPYLNRLSAAEWVDRAKEYGDAMRIKAEERKERGAGFRGGPFAMMAHRYE